MPSPKSKLNNAVGTASSQAKLKRARRNIYLQAGLAFVTILLTVVIIFAMTAAWYTNIVHTGGLTFEAAAWGFDGTIVVGASAVKAAPGDEGIIELTVTNDTDATSDISINISKAGITQEMQKRLFFYVDAHTVRNGEGVERVYLNNQDSYTYTLFSYASLVLTEDYHNDAQLKWQWVYDVLGYYVLGSYDAQSQTMSEQEYLRPIEYDYDAATTTFVTKPSEEETEGETEAETDAAADAVLQLELETVDGETTLDDFLVAFSQKDGYLGTIDPEAKNEAGYYPVDVDENGFGVWAYLCTYSEIEMNTQYDTELGKQAALDNSPTYTARLTVSAQKSKTDITLVSTEAALTDAIKNQDGAIVRLDSDITLENALQLTAGQSLVLDLNGNDLNYSGNVVAVDAQSGSTVTMLNGSLTGTGGSGYGVLSSGAEVTFHNVEVTDFNYGIYVMDQADANHLDSIIRLTDCTMNVQTCAVFAAGNGSASAQKTQIIIERCDLTSDYNAVSGNGSNTSTYGYGLWGTDIQIIDSKLTGKWTAFYQPQRDSTATIYRSELTGFTGMVLKSGEVIVTDSVINGTGPATELQEPYITGGGYADTGDAIYVETGYGYEIVLDVHGNTILNSNAAQSLRVYLDTADNVKVTLYGGTYQQEQPEAYLAPDMVQTKVDDRIVIGPKTAENTGAAAEPAEEASEPEATEESSEPEETPTQ